MSEPSASGSGSNSHRDKRQKYMESEPPTTSLLPSRPQEDVYKEISDRIINDPMVTLILNQPINQALLPSLLFNIQSHAAKPLDPRYKDSTTNEQNDERSNSLLGDEDFKGRLMEAWRAKSFEEILKTIYPQHGTSETRPVKPQTEVERVQEVVEKAWKLPYQGNYHCTLLRNINDARGREPYLNIGAVVQSSGTGKSRMVDEQSKLVYTLPINIRGGGSFVAHPPSDVLLHDFLMATISDPAICKTRYLVFFWCLFSHVTQELNCVESSPEEESEETFATKWYKVMGDPAYRRTFYQTVIKSCKGVMNSVDNAKAKAKAVESLLALVGAVGERCKSVNPESVNPKIKVMLYIDEAHELDNKVGNSGCTQLDILCGAVADLCSLPLFCLLVGTHSSLQHLAPPTSECTWRAGGQLMAPHTQTPFDCAPDIKIYPGKLRLRDLVEPDYLAKWGRPLWWTMLKCETPGDCEAFTRLVKLARTKLLRQHDIYLSYLNIEEIAGVALVDVLLGLDYEPNRATTNKLSDMVANHMRIAYSVPRHREYFQSGYPSEPILAEAAAQQVHEFQRQLDMSRTPFAKDFMVRTLENALGSSWIDLGKCGEVVMRLLLMRAYMDGVRADHPGHPILFSRGCSLVTLIEQLFTRKAAEAILNSRPDNVQCDKDVLFRDYFGRSVVRFTHFVKADDDSVLDTEALFAAFARGMAFICHETQRYVDVVIPVLLDADGTLEEASMSAIMIQVRGHVRTRSGQAYGFFEEDLGVFPPDDVANRAYFVLVAELRGGGQREDTGKGKDTDPLAALPAFESTSSAVYVTSPPEIQDLASGARSRYLSTVYGCSGDLYRAIGKDQASYYECLLAPRNSLLDEHAYKSAASRSEVMMLKPLWSQGPDSFHWVESEMLNKC